VIFWEHYSVGKQKTAGQRRSPISLFLNVPDDAEIGKLRGVL
jgi:hypothetical protein